MYMAFELLNNKTNKRIYCRYVRKYRGVCLYRASDRVKSKDDIEVKMVGRDESRALK